MVQQNNPKLENEKRSCLMWKEIKTETVDEEYNRVFSNDESAYLWFKNFCHKYGLHVIECQKYNRWIVEGWNDWTNFMLWKSVSGPRFSPDEIELVMPTSFRKIAELRGDRPHIETNIDYPFELGGYSFGDKSMDTLSIVEEKMKEIIEIKQEVYNASRNS
jgi:hypothetical protein